MIERIEDLFDELRQRRAFRFLILYVGAAWALAQVAEFAVDNYGLSHKLLDITLFLLVVGLPALLTLIWFHGERGHQRVPRSEAAILAGLGVAAALGTWGLAARDTRVMPELEPGQVAVDLGEHSVAVLPFRNELDDPKLAWLDRGVADLLATDLAQLDTLRVVGGQRIYDLLRQEGLEEERTVPEALETRIAARAGVRYMMSGWIRGSADDLTINATLLDLRTGELMAGVRERGGDVFALVDRISRRMSGQILAETGVEAEPLASVAELTTRDLEAYAAYQRGRRARERFLLREAEEQMRRAVSLDSTFALAYFELAGVQVQRGNYGDAARNLQRARENLTAATERDRLFIEGLSALIEGDRERAIRTLGRLIARYPDEKDARIVLANVLRTIEGREAEARRLLEETVLLDPAYATGYNLLAYFQAGRGAHDSALALIDEYARLQPGEPNPLDSRGEVLEMAGRTDEARAAYRDALEIREDFTVALRHLVRSWLEEDRPDGARRDLAAPLDAESTDTRVVARELLGDVHVWEGRFDAAVAAKSEAIAEATAAERTDLRVNALRDLLFVELALGRYREAAGLAERLAELQPLEGAPYLADAVRAGESGDLDGVRALARGFEERFRDDPTFAPFFEQVAFVFRTYEAFYAGEHERVVELAGRTPAAQGGSVEYPQFPVMRSLLALGRVEDARAQLDVIADGTFSEPQGNFDPMTARHLQYYKGRVHELAGDTAAARAAYGQLVDGWGEATSGVPLVADAPERLARLGAAPR